VKILDHVGACGVVHGDQLAQILCVELLAERGRFDQVAEDDREMSALRARQRLLTLDERDLVQWLASLGTRSERPSAPARS
jgi:hypothetical protein